MLVSFINERACKINIFEATNNSFQASSRGPAHSNKLDSAYLQRITEH